VIAHFQNVSSEYFRTIGVPLVRGRWLDATDRDSLNPNVLITQSVVDKAFGGADPIGKRVQVGGPGDPWGTVVGVIGDFRQYRLPQDAPPAVFNTIDEFPTRQMTIVMRAKSGDPHRLVPLLRSAVRELDANVALFQVQTLDEAVARALWRERLMGSMLASFAALALAMACLGLYGVVSYMVSSRTRELGVRVALGATRGSIAGLVVGQGARLVAIGIVTGLIGAWFGVRILASLLHGVSTTDPWTFAIVGVGLGAVAMVATAIPSVRAVRVDPIVAMRVE
jgi:predicted permease